VASAMEPPVEAPSGLGNFKGVMLCNRPEEGPKAAEAGPQPFKSACAPTYGEQLGLNPPVREADPKKMPEMKPNESLVRHHKWLKQLQEDVSDAKMAQTLGEEGEKQKEEKLKDFCQRQRDAMKELREEAKALGTKLRAKDVAAAVEGRMKPKWAMTEKQSEEMDEEQTLELLDFADNLNFDEYMNDLDFREAVGALKGRANKMAYEQDKFKKELCAQFNDAEGEGEEGAAPPAEDGDLAVEGQAAIDDDALSMVTSHTGISGDRDRKKKRRDDEESWDSSTRTSDVTSVDPDRRDLADRVLADNADMRSVHSAASVQRMIERVERDKAAGKAKAAQDMAAKVANDELKVAALVEALSAQKAPPAPLIQVHMEDARCNKPVDPSMLPYLYRSPAI